MNQLPRDITLPGLQPGQTGIVDQIVPGRGSVKRLADLGFTHGASVTMLRPGSPCLVRLNGVTIGLGRAYQECIRLRADKLPSNPYDSDQVDRFAGRTAETR